MQYLDEFKSSHKWEDRLISLITAAELYFGCNSEEQAAATTEFLQNFKIISISTETMIKAGELRRNFTGKKKPRLADALIATTALLQNAKVHTHNVDDFSWVDGLEVEIPYTV